MRKPFNNDDIELLFLMENVLYTLHLYIFRAGPLYSTKFAHGLGQSTNEKTIQSKFHMLKLLKQFHIENQPPDEQKKHGRSLHIRSTPF